MGAYVNAAVGCHLFVLRVQDVIGGDGHTETLVLQELLVQT